MVTGRCASRATHQRLRGTVASLPTSLTPGKAKAILHRPSCYPESQFGRGAAPSWRGFTTSRSLQGADSTLLEGKPQSQTVDAVILGGGVVGLALAASLARNPRLGSNARGQSQSLRIVLLEATDLDRARGWLKSKHSAQSSSKAADGIEWDNRVVSLTWENWTWLQDIGAAKYLDQERLQPVTGMHVTDGLSGAALDLGQASDSSSSSSSSSGSSLSVMVELSNLQQALLRFLDESKSSAGERVQVEVWDKTKVENIFPDAAAPEAASGSEHVEAWPLLQVAPTDDSGSQQTILRPRLLIGADGPSSPVRKYAGIQKFGWPYGCKGLVGTLRFDVRDSQAKGYSVAYQRFLPSGTIAWLPLSQSAASMVWSLPPRLAQALTQLHRATPTGERSVLADLVTAAWRLPWASLSYLFSRIEGGIDGALLRDDIAARLQAEAQAGNLINEGQCPPVVEGGIDANSVASFPLQVAHAESYLGSSLEAKNALREGRASLFPDPSSLLRSAVRLASDFVGGTAQHDAVSPAPHGRTVLIGDAAHSIHPLAGQGLNLGLSDARSLCNTLESASAVGGDWGSHESLKSYEADRWTSNQMMLVATDRLHYIYTAPVPARLDYRSAHDGQGATAPGSLPSPAAPLLDAFYSAKVWARSTGVEVLNELDAVKDLMQRMAGSGNESRASSRRRR